MFKEMKYFFSLVLREHLGKRQLHLKTEYKLFKPVVPNHSCTLESCVL